MPTKSHMFMVGDTVTAALKKYNFHDISPDEMTQLLNEFRELNRPAQPGDTCSEGYAIVRPGMRAKIPILERHLARAFPPPETTKEA